MCEKWNNVGLNGEECLIYTDSTEPFNKRREHKNVQLIICSYSFQAIGALKRKAEHTFSRITKTKPREVSRSLRSKAALYQEQSRTMTVKTVCMCLISLVRVK